MDERISPTTQPILGSAMSIDHGICTNIGQRPENQDRVLVVSGRRGHLFAVADGMGGHSGGALASRLAGDRLKDSFVNEPNESEEEMPDALGRYLVEAVIRADRFIRWHGRHYRTPLDMGTTLSCLHIAGQYGVIAHVGDSRIYRLRKGRLSRLTVDHTFVQDMILEGELTPSQALRHPLRHVLTQVVGTSEPLELADSRIDGVTFHHYAEFLNEVRSSLVVEDGIVKHDGDIWIYLGDGSAPTDQILYRHSRFHLRNAQWAPKPVTRVTWLGSEAYARHYGKRLPSIGEWRVIEKQLPNVPGVDRVPSTDATMHSHMNAEASVSIGPLAILDNAVVKEWLASRPMDTASSGSSVVMWTRDGYNGVGPQVAKRYPWEGFEDVGFRTVREVESGTSDR